MSLSKILVQRWMFIANIPLRAPRWVWPPMRPCTYLSKQSLNEKKKKKKKNNSVPLICSCRRSTRGVFITLKTNFPFYICSCFSFRLSNRFCLYLSSPLKSSALMFDPFSQQKRLLNVRARTSGLSSRKWVRFSVQLQMNLRYGYNAGKFQTHFCPTYWSFLLN